jgi:hypothetical protein
VGRPSVPLPQAKDAVPLNVEELELTVKVNVAELPATTEAEQVEQDTERLGRELVVGQAFTRLAMLTLPKPVPRSYPWPT